MRLFESVRLDQTPRVDERDPSSGLRMEGNDFAYPEAFILLPICENSIKKAFDVRIMPILEHLQSEYQNTGLESSTSFVSDDNSVYIGITQRLFS